MEKMIGTTPPLGGHVSDLLGSLKGLEENKEYTDSMDPNGNPFADKGTAKEMVGQFISMHPGKDDLEILGQRLNDFYKVKPGEEQELPKEYTEAKTTLQEALSSKK